MASMAGPPSYGSVATTQLASRKLFQEPTMVDPSQEGERRPVTPTVGADNGWVGTAQMGSVQSWS